MLKKGLRFNYRIIKVKYYSYCNLNYYNKVKCYKLYFKLKERVKVKKAKKKGGYKDLKRLQGTLLKGLIFTPFKLFINLLNTINKPTKYITFS